VAVISCRLPTAAVAVACASRLSLRGPWLLRYVTASLTARSLGRATVPVTAAVVGAVTGAVAVAVLGNHARLRLQGEDGGGGGKRILEARSGPCLCARG